MSEIISERTAEAAATKAIATAGEHVRSFNAEPATVSALLAVAYELRALRYAISNGLDELGRNLRT